jgi:hypothetical protein
MDLAAKNVGAWGRVVHCWISLVFAALGRSAADLLIGGVCFVDRCLDDVDLELGMSGGA